MPVRAFPGPEVRATRRSAIALVLFVMLVGGAARANATTTAERAVHAMINEARAQAGVRLLPLSDRLSRIAHRHSAAMANKGTLFHSCLACSISNFRRLAENVGYGPNRVTVQQEFLANPPHRLNLLNPKFRRVGVGLVRRGGLVWVTQIFYA